MVIALKKCIKIILNKLMLILILVAVNDVLAEISMLYDNSVLCVEIQSTLKLLPRNKDYIDFSSLQNEGLKSYSKLRLDAEYTSGAKFDRYVRSVNLDIDNDGTEELVLRTDEMIVRSLYRIELYALEYTNENINTLKNNLARHLEDTGWLSGVGLKIPRVYNLPLNLSVYPLAESGQVNINHVLPSFVYYSGKNYLVLEEIGRFNRYVLFTEIERHSENFVPQIKCIFKK